MSEDHVYLPSETRPVVVKQQHLEYLDDLRESGETNMFGAGRYVEEEFEISRSMARVILSYWMETFGKEKR